MRPICALVLALSAVTFDDYQDKIRYLSILDAECIADLSQLIAVAPKEIEFFAAIIDNPKSSFYRLCRTYYVLDRAKIDHKRFLSSALRDVLSDNASLRSTATDYIGKAGSANESGVLLMLLSDPEYSVVHSAVLVLSNKGDDRTVVALNIWLRHNPEIENTPANRIKVLPRRAVISVRDTIQARLDAAKKAPPVDPMPKK